MSSSDDDNERPNNIYIIKNISVTNYIYNEMVLRQLRNVPLKWKLNISDIKRICKYIDVSIFSDTDCCLWKGYITNMNNKQKGTYINFYFKKKKIALHRLLYSNYVAPLSTNEYIKFSCKNKGICCNVSHYNKFTYIENVSSTKINIFIEDKTQTPTKDRLLLSFN